MSEESPKRDVLELVSPGQSETSAQPDAAPTPEANGDTNVATTPPAAATPANAPKDDGAADAMPPGEAQITAPADMSDEEFERLRTDLVAALKTVFDPEIPSDIYELGLIYRVDIGDNRDIDVVMTLTAPGCPVAGEMPVWVENAVASVAGVGAVNVALVFDPPWDMSRMSDEARLALNMF